MSGIPTRPSNRHLFDTMVAWGWVPGKPHNGHVEMIFDGEGRIPKTKVTIAQSGHHAATADDTIKMVIQMTTGGNRHAFWGKLPAGGTIALPTKEREAPTRVGPAPVEPTPTPKPIEPLKPLKQSAKKRNPDHRGCGSATLELLIRTGNPMSVDAIHKELPNFPRSSIVSACSYLVQINRAERIMRNIYRVKTNLQTGSTVHHEGSIDHAVDRIGQALGNDPRPLWETQPDLALAKSPGAPKLEEVGERVPLAIVPDDSKGTSTPPKLEPATNPEETMDLVLDLMFPNGFKASHLNLIEAWKNITRNLMKAVQS